MHMDITNLLEYYRKMAEVSEEDFNDAFIDDDGVTYSKDGKRLLKGNDIICLAVKEGVVGRLRDYAIKEDTEVICDEAFDCCQLKDIKFPKSLKYIGAKAFFLCSSFTLPNGLLGIGEQAFGIFAGYNKNLRIPDSVVYIGKEAFMGSKITRKLIIGNGVKRIEENTFRDTWAKKIHIGESVAYIGNLAFGENYTKGIVIPPNVKELEGNPFGGCAGQIFSMSDKFVVKNKVLYTKDGKELIACFSKAKELTIPNTVKRVRSCAFMRSEIETVILPDSITEIGIGAFGYAKIKSVRLPKGLKVIPTEAFCGSDIESIVIPDAVLKIEPYAFNVCKKLEVVQMSNNIESIEEQAFSYCMKLRTMNFPKTLKFIGDKAFFCCHKLKRNEEELGINVNID